MFCSILEQYALKWGKRSAIGTIPAQRLFSLKSINLPKQLCEFSQMKRNDGEANNAKQLYIWTGI